MPSLPHPPHSLPPTNERPSARKTLLVTCGPTHEPIDAVRYIGNRSSGRMGLAIAEAARVKGWNVRLLAGPGVPVPADVKDPQGSTPVAVRQFRTTADLQALLADELPGADVLVMAAAVADYRPKPIAGLDPETGKLKRSGGPLSIELEPTPDLLAECGRNRRPGQVLIGFALEPRDRLLESAKAKLQRKNVDAIVANPLATMDSPTIEGLLVTPGVVVSPDPAGVAASGGMSKEAFAAWLMDQIERMHEAAQSPPPPPPRAATARAEG